MTVEAARMVYVYWAKWQRKAMTAHLRGTGRSPDLCSGCHKTDRRLFAASIALDLLVAEASLKRMRESVPW